MEKVVFGIRWFCTEIIPDSIEWCKWCNDVKNDANSLLLGNEENVNL